jgi:hypothetical protein
MKNKISTKKIKSIVIITSVLLFLTQLSYSFYVIAPPEISAAIDGSVVAFEESHNPMTVHNTSNPYSSMPGAYDTFVEFLENNSYIIETIDNGETINQETLQSIDILVIVNSNISYTAQEIEEISSWVNNGGSLLLIVEWWTFGNEMRSITNYFGYNYPYESGLNASDNLVGSQFQFYIDESNIVEHEITNGISRLELYGATGLNETPTEAVTLIDTDNDDTTGWEIGGYANDVPVLSILSGGPISKGRLVVITDSSMWIDNVDTDSDSDVNFYDSNHNILGLNIINWLAIKSTKQFSLEIFPIVTFFIFITLFIGKRRKN